MELLAMHKYTIVAVFLIACHFLLSADAGRHLKEVSKNRSVPGKKLEVMPSDMSSKSTESGDSIEGYENDFRPTTPGNSPGVGHSFADEDEDMQRKHAGNGRQDIRPTNPGHSPGVGHSFGEDDKDMQQKPAGSINKNDRHFLAAAGNAEGVRPTNPGHSPGVGHSFGEDDEDIQRKPRNVNNEKNFVAADKEDVRPTNPGHSPGVGHALSKNTEPKA